MEKKYHLILSDELGEEYSIELFAHGSLDLLDKVSAEYPESGIVYYRELKLYNREY